MKRPRLLFLLPLAFSGCATSGKSTGLGAGIGAGSGMLVGAIADPNAEGGIRTRNIIVGGALGGIAGAVFGHEIHKAQDHAHTDGVKEGVKIASTGIPQPPNLLPAKYEARWVEAKVTGNRYVEGHYEFIIIEQAKWQGSQ